MAKKDLLEIIKHPRGINIIRVVIPTNINKEKYIKYFSEELVSNGFPVYDSSNIGNKAYFFVKGLGVGK